MAAAQPHAGPPAMVMPVDESEQPLRTLQGSRLSTVLPFLSQELLAQQAAYRRQHHARKEAKPEASDPSTAPLPLASGDAQRTSRLAPPQSQSGNMLNNLPPRNNNTRTNILDYLT